MYVCAMIENYQNYCCCCYCYFYYYHYNYYCCCCYCCFYYYYYCYALWLPFWVLVLFGMMKVVKKLTFRQMSYC